jgi:hypothetical protein
MMRRSMSSHIPCFAPAVICGPTLSNTSHCTFLLSTCTFIFARSALFTRTTSIPVSFVNGSAKNSRTPFSYTPPQEVTVIDCAARARRANTSSPTPAAADVARNDRRDVDPG